MFFKKYTHYSIYIYIYKDTISICIIKIDRKHVTDRFPYKGLDSIFASLL